MGLLTAKTSILAFFIRLFGTVRWLRITCYALSVLAAIAYGSYSIVQLIYCVPYNGNKWDSKLVNRCGFPRKVSGITISAFSVAADLIMFIVPFPVISKLSLSREKRHGLVVVFFFGLLILVTSVVGMACRVMTQLQITNDESWQRANITITT